MKNTTKLIHTIGSPDKETGSVVQPIHTSTIFAMDTPSSSEGFQYGRVGNPTREILERTLADLEGGAYAAAFSSGSAALTCVFSTLKSGDHILCHSELYEGTGRILRSVFKNFGIEHSTVDMTSIQNIKKQMRSNTKIMLFETPTNPTLTLLNIKQICQIARNASVLSVVDNTLASPCIQKPLVHGADIVIESLTKIINGHTDAIGGIVATNNAEIFSKIKFLQHTLGAILSPGECSQILRSLKTLTLRQKQQQYTAKMLSSLLKKHHAVDQIFFPGILKKDRQLIQKQMGNSPGTILSFTLKSGIDLGKFLQRLQVVIVAHSFGGVETIIQQPKTMMDLSKDTKIQKNFFRLSVGLEDPEDLINDIKQALDQTDPI